MKHLFEDHYKINLGVPDNFTLDAGNNLLPTSNAKRIDESKNDSKFEKAIIAEPKSKKIRRNSKTQFNKRSPFRINNEAVFKSSQQSSPQENHQERTMFLFKSKLNLTIQTKNLNRESAEVTP